MEYGKTLLKVASSVPRLAHTAVPSLALSEAAQDLKRRLTTLKRSPGARPRWWQLLPAALLLSVLVAGSGARPPGAAEETPAASAETDASDSEILGKFAEVLAAGDFKTLQEYLELEDSLDRDLTRALVSVLAETKESRVNLVSMRRISKDAIYACFLVENAPDIWGASPAPLFMTFRRTDGKWRGPSPINLRAIVGAREHSPEKLGRRSIARTLIAYRFSSTFKDSWRGQLMAQADAFEKLSKPPYNLSNCEPAAKGLRARAKALGSVDSWQDVQRFITLEMRHLPENMRPRADDFYLSFYLEAEEGPDAQKLPVLNKDGKEASDEEETFLAERFPCLTEESILKATLTADPNTFRSSVLLELTKGGAKIFGEVTRRSVKKKLAIVLDGKVVSAPVIRSAIPGGRALITGNFTAEEAQQIADRLNAYRKKGRDLLESIRRGRSGQGAARKE